MHDVATLKADTVVGPIALAGSGRVQVEAEPGLVLHVRTGSVAVSRAYDPREYYVRAGRNFVAERSGPIVIEAFTPAELSLDWPADCGERLSPGLEPLSL